MPKSLQSIRGMNDLLPEDTPAWRYVEDIIHRLMKQYDYHEIRTPLVEMTGLFQRGVGEHTDIVEKEMYTFADRNHDSLTLRPECTAGIVRAGIQHGLLYRQIQRLWTIGSVFRHERPQKGRYRQFHQLSVEAFGTATPAIDAELILMNARLWRLLNISDTMTLQLNTLGTNEERAHYRDALVDYLNQYRDDLDEDSQRRLVNNPLRILDSKDKNTQKIIRNAPVMHDYLGATSKEEFAELCAILDTNKVPYVINPTLVRGLDYYCRTVFEWTTEALGAQGTVSAGGRYDLLVEMLGGKPTPACGFAIGMERLILLLQAMDKLPAQADNNTDIMIIASDSVSLYAMTVAETIRDARADIKLRTSTQGSFKSQMKRADRSGAFMALIIGEDEAKQSMVTVKYLREDKPQQTCSLNEVIALIE